MTERPAETAGGSGVADRGEDTAGVRTVGQRIQATLAQATRTNQTPAAAPGEQVASSRPTPRRAHLRLTRIDPWSVMKMAFLLSIAIGVVTIVAVAVVWAVLGAAGVWDSVNQAVQDIVGEEGANWDVENYLGTARVLGFTMIVSVIDVVLLTAVATLGAFLYNMAAALLGGVEVTLTEDR